MSTVTTQFGGVLQDLTHSLSFDSIALAEEISSSTVIVAFQLLDHYDIFSSLPIDQKILAQYIIKVSINFLY